MSVRRLITAFAVCCSLGAVGAGDAQAGTFHVRVCSDGNGSGTNDVFAPSAFGIGRAFPDCAPGRGLFSDVAPWGGWAGFPEGGTLQMCAPSGTRVAGFSANARTWWQGAGYERRADGGPCGGYEYLAGGALPPQFDAYEATTLARSDIGAGGLRLSTFCGWTPCTGNYAQTFWDSITVAIDDYTPPAITNPRGLFGQTGWVRGSWNVAFDAGDSTGIRRLEAHVDYASGGRWAVEGRPCQPSNAITRVNPCDQTSSSFSRAFDTVTVGNGSHTVGLWAQDGGSNEVASTPHVFHVDNSAPTASLDRAAGSHSRTVAWRVTDAHSGVDGGSLAASYSTNGGTSWQPMGGSWNAGAGTYSAVVPVGAGDGSLQVRVSGRDNANPGGNSFTSAASTVTVDTAAPAAPTIGVPGRWLGGDDPPGYDVALSTPAPHPATGIAGYSVTRDGSDPDDVIDRDGAAIDWRVDDLPEGTTTVKARAVSGTGIASDTAAAVVRVDRTAPAVTVLGAGSPGTRHAGPVTVNLGARDAGSGMGAADDDRPVTDGAYVAYRIDGADWVRARGDEVHIPVAGHGTHVLEHFAVDAAGNRSATTARSIVIGRAVPGEMPLPAGFADRSSNPATFTAASRFGDPCPDQATLTADRDATMAERDPNAKAGGLEVGPTGARRDAVVGFPLPAAPDCVVESATLRLHAADAGAPGRPIEVRRASSSWGESTVTWNTRPGTVGGGVSAPVAPGWMRWDVTAQVQALYRNGDNGLYLRDIGPVDPSGATKVGFCARESTETSCAGRQPQLVVRFSR